MAEPNPDERIADRYIVRALLGRGGSSTVYRVYDPREERELALKRLTRRANRDPMLSSLFEREFLTLSDLAHPRIIEVYDYGVDGEGAYYTMELLSGEDLRTLGKLAPLRVSELLRDVVSSLAILHSRRLLHNDVSARNVRCTLDGRAKLIDFGAMSPMGFVKRVLGTPPFMAPEMLNQQSLDGRADLYACGAIAYSLLTGLLAYPAHDFRHLRELWQRPLPAPHKVDRAIPVALSELVMELMQLNCNARPRTAAIVMERLCSIAGLPLEEAPDVASAYLTTPTLVGRDDELRRVRDTLIDAARGQGSALVVAAPSGRGRTRFLEACTLEAKLLGMYVVRVDRGDAEPRSFAAAAALGRQLLELGTEHARAIARLHAPVLAHVLGAEALGVPPSEPPPHRTELLAALVDFVLNTSRSLRLLIAVDDADRVDDASAALLATLARKLSRRSVCLVLTLDPEQRGNGITDRIDLVVPRIELDALTEAQTESLLSSVFGDVKHLVTVARRVHAIARGNPRAILQLAAHLVDQRIARYEAGGFILPERLRETDLPPSLAELLLARIGSLDADALELARVLALTDPSELPSMRFPELTSHQDRARTFRALDALLRVQILEQQGERYRLTDPAWSAALSDGLSDRKRIALHTSLASAFEEAGTLARRSYHLMESNQAPDAIHLMLAPYLQDPNEPQDPLADFVPGYLDQLERAANAADELRLAAPLRADLRMKVCGAAYFLADCERFLRIGQPLVAQLVRESGLADYGALDPNLDTGLRIQRALALAAERHAATPLLERGLPPPDAIRELTRLCSMYSGVASMVQDIRLIEELPRLDPLVPLSAAVAATQNMIEVMRALMQGREARACELAENLLDRLQAPDGAGLGQLYNKSFRLGALYILSLSKAGAGISDAERLVVELESEPGYRINAQRVYLVCQLMRGDAEAAAATQRRIELMMLQDAQQQRYPASTVRMELLACWLSDDLSGLKLISERLAQMLPRFPGLAALMHLSRCLYRRFQGDAEGALVALQPALELTAPLAHRDWAWVVAAQVQMLAGLGRIDEAIELGLRHGEECLRLELSGYDHLARAVAKALIRGGQAQRAVPIITESIERALANGVRGLPLGALYELRARAARALGDDAEFLAFCERCAAEYKPERNEALAARCQRLWKSGGLPASAPPEALWHSDIIVSPATISGAGSIAKQLHACPDAFGRADCALSIVARELDLDSAYLYAVHAGRVTLFRAREGLVAPDGLLAAVERHLAALLEGGGEVADVALLDTAAGPTHAVLLVSRSDGIPVIAGVIACRLREPKLSQPSAAVVEAVASALLEHDDVEQTTLVQPPRRSDSV